MRKRLYISALSWDKHHLAFSQEPMTGDHQIPLQAIEISLPDDLIPSDEVFAAMTRNHELDCAEKRVLLLQEQLEQAQDKVRGLLALPSG